MTGAIPGILAAVWLLSPTTTVLTAPGSVPPPAAGARPHIVFVLADDLGPGDVGCYGGRVAPTPNLDRLAREGTRFTQYYAASPICSPSRCGLLTGDFPARWRITSFLQTRAGNRGCEQADYLDLKAPSLPRALKADGYRTAHFGKWHLGGGRDVSDPPPFAAYGYDEHAGTWESPQPHPDITAGNWIWFDQDNVKRWDRTAFFIDRTLDFLKRHQGKPCFVNVWLDDPHTPWVPSAEAKKGDTADNLRRVLAENDRQIGRLLDGLNDLGIANDTLVIFASDNGPLPTFQGDRTLGLRGSKLSLYEGGIRLPFLARWPGRVPAGKVDGTTVLAAVDLFPTFGALAGAELPKDMQPDGEDRSAALLGKPAAARARPLFWEYGRNEQFFRYPGNKADRSPNVAIRDGGWKLLVNADGTGVELYDLATDPKEAKNLAAERPAVANRLKGAALAWRKSLPKKEQP
jgi:arylsulfatase A-like enzyme